MSLSKFIHRVVYCFIVATTYLKVIDVHANDINAMHTAGEQHFKTYCASCHLGAMPEAPKVDAIKLYPPERIISALESGVMSTQGIALTKQDKHNVAFYLTGKQVQQTKIETQFSCQQMNIEVAELNQAASWNGWGQNHSNNRFQYTDTLSSNNINKLSLKWAFAFPDATRVRSQPIITPQVIYIGSQEGTVYALDRKTGCVRWQFDASSEVRGALYLQHNLNNQPNTLYFGDFKANVYAVNAQDGKLKWKTKVGQHPMATITGSVIAYQDKVYIPLSSTEVIPAARPNYECCTFSGGLVALNSQTGKQLWHFHTTDKAVKTDKSSVGTQQWGPSGAPIWSSPTLDIKRGLVYVTTGQNYSLPATKTSDAILAINMQHGTLAWVTQVTANDVWNGACMSKRPNCPENSGPDFDIGTSAIITTDKNGIERILVGQKSGMVYALDPDNNGKILWQTRVGSGGTMGGVHWGLSADNEEVYVGISDLPTKNPFAQGKPNPGVSALELNSGNKLWHYRPKLNCKKDDKFLCFNGVSAAVSSSPGLVYAGSLDGIAHILSAKTGKLLWQYDTKLTVKTMNGIKGFGGAIEADGPIIADDELFITSGYDKWGEKPGNLLMVFSLGQ